MTIICEQLPENVKITRELVEGYGYDMLEAFGIHSWSIVWNNTSKSTLGWCKYKAQRIELSAYAFDRMPDKREMVDTVLHEVAHVLAGSKAAHDNTWKTYCRKVGARPERCAPGSSVVKAESDYKWSRGCVDCDSWGHFHRKPKLKGKRSKRINSYQRRVTNYTKVCRACRQPVVLRQNY